jgi:hypothetical protein
LGARIFVGYGPRSRDLATDSGDDVPGQIVDVDATDVVGTVSTQAIATFP